MRTRPQAGNEPRTGRQKHRRTRYAQTLCQMVFGAARLWNTLILLGFLGWRREGDSNSRCVLGTHALQACALNHSAISPANG